MKVLLPDRSELELPDGATGLDAARAIGPKLAEQAVLVRSNGHVRDLRLPLEDGEQIQILTTRDTSDPDALAVLRHSSAHLLAEAVRRLYPGVKVAIGPPIENGFYYDFDFPEPISRGGPPAHRGGDRTRAEGGPRLEPRGDLPRRGQGALRGRGASPTRSSSSTPPRATSRCTRRATSPTSAAARTSRTRSRSRRSSSPGLAGAYWRGDSTKPQLTRIYGTAFYSQEDLDAYLERLEEARRRDHRRLGQPARPLPPLRAFARLAVLAPEGHGDLERPRGPAPPREREARLRRGEDAAPLRRRDLHHLGSLRQLPRQHVLHPVARRRARSSRSSR